MDVTILTTGENHKEFRVQIQTSTGVKHHLKISKPHPANLTAAQFQAWFLDQIGIQLAALSTQASVTDTTLNTLVGQTVSVTLPTA